MKKILLILSILAGCLTASAATDTALDNLATSMNRTCPRNAGDGLTLSQVKNADDTFTFVYSISDQMFDNIANLAGILHDSTLAEMQSSPKEETQQLLNLCRQNNVTIIITFTNTKGNTFDIKILPQEL